MPNARRFPPPWTIGEKTTPASLSATTTARARQQDHFSNNFRGDGYSVDVVGTSAASRLKGWATKNPRLSQTGGDYCDCPSTAAPAASFNRDTSVGAKRLDCVAFARNDDLTEFGTMPLVHLLRALRAVTTRELLKFVRPAAVGAGPPADLARGLCCRFL